ncbi:allophanate hydrolase subunit 1 [Micromonospora sp. NPDC049274]|uniref:5-oxoprolinase subunit B family protein n=1 Tax=Micromonospora sp. NPDC049274 TaxID=3154829 RepID=UPI0034367FEB
MRIRPAGVHALLLDCTEPADIPEAALVEAWRAELWHRREQGDLSAVEIVPAARTILLDGLPDPAATADLLSRWAPAAAAAARDAVPARASGDTTCGGDTTRGGDTDRACRDIAANAGDHGAEVVVPVEFDGPDLPLVAEHWGVDVPAVLRRLTDTRFRVAFCGFAPGFPYLTGLPADLALPRLPTPRPRVPAGSVALAGPYAGIYPSASPGGWLLVGRTDLPLFDVDDDPPARLGPGTRVRMVAT